MVFDLEQRTIEQLAAQLQPHIDAICLGAMESQRGDPNGELVKAAQESLEQVKNQAAKVGAVPVVECAELVEESFRLAKNNQSAPAQHLGHFVTSVAADLVRILHYLVKGEDVQPVLIHARRTVGSMPRKGTDYLVEIDITDREQVARVFAKVSGAPAQQAGSQVIVEPSNGTDSLSPDAEVAPSSTPQDSGKAKLNRLVREFDSHVMALQATPDSITLLTDLLDSLRAIEVTAAQMNADQIKRLAISMEQVVAAHQATASPLSQNVIDFIVACQHALPNLVSAVHEPDRVERQTGELVERAGMLIRKQTAELLGHPALPDEWQTGELVEPDDVPGQESAVSDQEASGQTATSSAHAAQSQVEQPRPRSFREAFRFRNLGPVLGEQLRQFPDYQVDASHAEHEPSAEEGDPAEEQLAPEASTESSVEREEVMAADDATPPPNTEMGVAEQTAETESTVAEPPSAPEPPTEAVDAEPGEPAAATEDAGAAQPGSHRAEPDSALPGLEGEHNLPADVSAPGLHPPDVTVEEPTALTTDAQATDEAATEATEAAPSPQTPAEVAKPPVETAGFPDTAEPVADSTADDLVDEDSDVESPSELEAAAEPERIESAPVESPSEVATFFERLTAIINDLQEDRGSYRARSELRTLVLDLHKSSLANDLKARLLRIETLLGGTGPLSTVGLLNEAYGLQKSLEELAPEAAGPPGAPDVDEQTWQPADGASTGSAAIDTAAAAASLTGAQAMESKPTPLEPGDTADGEGEASHAAPAPEGSAAELEAEDAAPDSTAPTEELVASEAVPNPEDVESEEHAGTPAMEDVEVELALHAEGEESAAEVDTVLDERPTTDEMTPLEGDESIESDSGLSQATSEPAAGDLSAAGTRSDAEDDPPEQVTAGSASEATPPSDVGGFVGQLSGVLAELERNRVSSDARGQLGSLLQSLRESPAPGVDVADHCERIESLLEGTESLSTVGLLNEAYALLDDLEAIAIDGGVTGRLSDRGWLAVHRAADEALDLLPQHVGQLLVRSGGHEQRSRRLARVIEEVAETGDRLQTVVEQIRRETPSAAAGLDQLTDNLTGVAEELEHLRHESGIVAARLGDVVAAVEAEVHSLRQVPLATLVPELERAVRGLARRHGKSARLVVEGETTRIDRRVLPSLMDSLRQLIRNAVEHGIESPEARLSAGKSEQGTIRLRAFQDDHHVVVQINDDGAGIDEERIAQRATEQGFHVPADATRREQVLECMFFPGVTTKDTGGDRSSQGLGLEAVSTVIAELLGEVRVASEAGGGTTFTLQLPITTTRAEAVIVNVAEEHYAIPFEDIEVVDSSTVRSIEPTETGYLGELGSEQLPVLDLGALLGVRSARTFQDRSASLLRVRIDDASWLIRVDGFLGRREIAISPVSSATPARPGVVGETVLASHQTALILDVAQVLGPSRLAKRRDERRGSETTTLTALIASQSTTVRRKVAHILERRGWRAIEARDGLEAWEVLSAAGPGLVIVDLDLPRLERFQAMASAQSEQRAPIIALAAQDNDAVQAQVVAIGANAYLTKPSDTALLLQTLDQVIHSMRAQR